MPSSSDTRKATLRIQTGNDLADIRVLDSNLDIVARSSGSLDEEMDAGVYRVQVRSGASSSEALLVLRPGETRQHDATLAVPLSAAPIRSQKDVSTEQFAAVGEATSQNVPYGSGQLVLFLRNLRPGMPPMPDAPMAGLSLLGADGVPFDIHGAVQVSGDRTCASVAQVLAPGPCILRRNAGGEREFDQSIWIAEGWTTLLFVPMMVTRGSSGKTATPSPALASCHLLRTNSSWSAYHYEDTREALALETLLADLRQGRQLRSRSLIDFLLHGKYANPMLGMAAVHGLFLAREPDLDRIARIIENLELLVPQHPDVAALRWMLDRRKGTLDQAGAPPIWWPPMFAVGFKEVVECDRQNPTALMDQSVAERAAVNLVAAGIWSTWTPVAASPEVEARTFAPRGAEVASRLTTQGGSSLEALQSFLHDSEPGSGQEQRIRNYLIEATQYTSSGSAPEFIESLDAGTISRALGLPARPVANAVSELKAILTHREA